MPLTEPRTLYLAKHVLAKSAACEEQGLVLNLMERCVVKVQVERKCKKIVCEIQRFQIRKETEAVNQWKGNLCKYRHVLRIQSTVRDRY